MKFTSIAILLSMALAAFSQEKDLQLKMDSILQEADLLYSYEKAVWNATDILLTDKKLKKKYGGYVVYHTNDTICVSMLHKNQKETISKYQFVTSNVDNPFVVIEATSPLSAIEQELLDVKVKVIKQLSNSKYEVTIPQDYSPNFVLLKEDDAYKFYILMGTTESGVIPFGNDYLFRTDTEGNITEWQKFHSRVIPAQSEIPDVGKITSSSHSHLRTTPYITATDICTFRLYAQYTELNEFSVYSPAIGKYMTYNIEENNIEITD